MTRSRQPAPEPLPESLIAEAARRLVATVSEVVPPQALLHLLNAQRELLLAVSSVVTHNMGRPTGTARPDAGKSRPRKPSKVDVD